MDKSDKKWPKEWTQCQVKGVSSGLVLYEKKYLVNGGIARITFHNEIRPGINALRDVMGRELRILLSDANYDPSIGVVVLTSYGDKSFLAGGDVSWEASGGLVEQLELGLADAQASMRRCRKPIICAVKGFCIASGNHLAYFCDFTIAADNAVFGQTGPRVGSPADGHIVSYLIRVVGAKKAREMWMLCRRYNAQEALQMGLVNAVVPLNKLDEEVEKWCEEILEKSPKCIEILKVALDTEFDYMRGTLGLQQVAMAPGFLEGEEAKEAQNGFLEKRKAQWWKFRGMPSPEERGLSSK
jgi:naphthoate synthase/2-ketocyclohexanecarboxyl-CoA hydrolase